MVARTLEKWLIRGIRRVQRDHVCDSQRALAAREPLDCIPGTHLTFSLDCEIEPTAAALEETFDHFGPPEPDRQLIAGHAWLRDDEFGGTDTIAVTNPNFILQQ